jgi:hypothetical protein
MKLPSLKSLLLLGFILMVFLRAEEAVVKLTPFSITDGFVYLVPSFGPYAPIDKVIAEGHWSGAIRLICSESIGYGSYGQRVFVVVLYRGPRSGDPGSNKPAVRMLSWPEKGKMPPPKDLSGDEAVAVLRGINASEFFALPAGPGRDSRDLEPAVGYWNVFGEEYRDGKAVRVMRDLETSVPARALIEAIGIKLLASEHAQATPK